MEILVIFFIGLCFGSFATMASHRLPREEEWIKTASHCPKCNHGLGMKDLLPVVSWVLSAGKCRYCKAPISPRYPLTELLMAGLFVCLYSTYGASIAFVLLALLTVGLVTMLVADLETGLIPDEIHFFLLPLGIGYHWVMGNSSAEVAFCAAASLGLGLLLHYGYFYLRGKHGLGLGDVKFLLVAGVWLADVRSLVVYIFLSGVIGVVLGTGWKIVTKEERFPFGPALAISLWLLSCYPASENLFWEGLMQFIAPAAQADF